MNHCLTVSCCLLALLALAPVRTSRLAPRSRKAKRGELTSCKIQTLLKERPGPLVEHLLCPRSGVQQLMLTSIAQRISRVVQACLGPFFGIDGRHGFDVSGFPDRGGRAARGVERATSAPQEPGRRASWSERGRQCSIQERLATMICVQTRLNCGGKCVPRKVPPKSAARAPWARPPWLSTKRAGALLSLLPALFRACVCARFGGSAGVPVCPSRPSGREKQQGVPATIPLRSCPPHVGTTGASRCRFGPNLGESGPNRSVELAQI